MSYTKTEWKAGDTVTSAKLNKIENQLEGLGGGAFFVVNATLMDEEFTSTDPNETVTGYVMDKTWQEIYDAIDLGKACVIKGIPPTFLYGLDLGSSIYIEIADLIGIANEQFSYDWYPDTWYGYRYLVGGPQHTFLAESPTDYPKTVEYSYNY